MSRLLLILFSFLLITSCTGDDEGTSTNCNSSVDQTQVLERYVGLIEKRVDFLSLVTNGLVSSAEAYRDNPDESTLDDLKINYAIVAQEWLRAEPFSYGSDGSLQTGSAINPFPVDERAVDAHVAAGSFDADLPSNFDRGLPALDYLLFNGTTTEVHQRFQNSLGASQVVLDFSINIRDQSTALQNSWQSNADAFRMNTGTSAGSGISVLINALSKHFEDTRRDRIGTPFGVTTLGFPNPQTVESPYSKQSLLWLRLAVEANQSAFFATDFTGNGGLTSLADYLRGLPTSDASSLVSDIEDQYTEMLAAISAIDGPLGAAVEQDVDDVQEAYNAISRQVVNLKTDVPSVACVSITYVDNPSDSD